MASQVGRSQGILNYFTSFLPLNTADRLAALRKSAWDHLPSAVTKNWSSRSFVVGTVAGLALAAAVGALFNKYYPGTKAEKKD